MLDEEGNRIRDANGKYVFNAVPTTDWGSPETLEHWREAWAEMCNAKFAEKGIDVRIDHRSYERQGVDLLPTIHEGATVRAMEKKGIRTEKGEFNRWIKATNAVIRDIKKKIALLFDWIAEAKAELAKPQEPNLVSLLNAYYTSRRAGAYSVSYTHLFFDFGDKKRPSTFRTLRPVNGLIFGIRFFKLAGGEQHFMLFADGKSTRDRRTSVARECSSLDGTK